MLWRKAWVETRWRFLLAFALLLGAAFVEIRSYVGVEAQFKTMAKMIAGRPDLLRMGFNPDQVGMRYHDFLWGFWFTQGVLVTMCAVILGYGGAVSRQAGGGALFTLSLPVTRSRLLLVRSAVGLGELAVLALVPALAIPLASPLIGQSFPWGEALLTGLTMLVSGAAAFGLTIWLSAVFADRRVAILAIAPSWLVGNLVTQDAARKGPLRVFDTTFHIASGQVPWPIWLASLLVGAAFLYAARRSLARRDF
jgi:hypothetical protein